MKLLLGIVSLVAVFTVNGRDFHKEPATGDNANEADGKDLHFQDGPIGDDSGEESQNLLGGLELQDFEEQDHQLKQKKGDHERTLRRSRCKARNACVVMGGFCVTNATLCSGRLVPEGCKGTNCQCCVPGTIEAKFDNFEQELQSLKANMNTELQSIKANMNTELQSIKMSINNSDSNINTELQSIKTNMNTELQSVKININNSDSNINTELQSIKTNMNTELQSIKININNSDSKLNTDLQSLKNNMNSSFSNMNSKLENQGCPEGLFLFTPSNQCFRLLTDKKRNWDSGKAACSALGLQLAHPYDPVSIRSYIITKYGGVGSHGTWLGGRGTGSYITWQRTGQSISSSNPLWYAGSSPSVATSQCLCLMTHESYWKSYPTQPLYSGWGCSASRWTLCELVSE